MEQSSISTNVTIDFQKKTQSQPPKRTYKPRTSTPNGHPKKTMPLPQLKHPTTFTPKQGELPVKIWLLGWLEQVWENMMFLEFKDDIIIIDAGLVFPGGEVFGVDYIIPDISYLKLRKDKIRWILITHGHLDHIWALKHVMPALWYPMMYASNLTVHMVKKAFEEAKILKNLKYKVINPEIDILKFWVFTVESFRVNHNIPESLGFAIHTPKWLVVTPGDYKIDFTPAIDKPADLAKIARIGQEWVRLMLGESTYARTPGRTKSEKIIWENLDALLKAWNSRMIIATFASNVWRLIQIIESAAKYDKIVFVAGRSMVNIIEIIKQLWYINVPHGFVRKMSEEVNTLPDNRVVVLCTWSQWEEFSALARISRGEHPQIQLRPWDQILMSSSPIPGNEKAFFSMLNNLVKNNIDLVLNADMDIHTSWHAYQEDIKIMTSLIKPEYAVPIHGELIQRHAHKKLLKEIGLKDENIFLPDNGSIIEMYDDGVKLSDRPLKLDTVMIDWLGMWHLSGEYVIKARQIMSEDWVLSLIFKIDTKSRELVGNIQIESRGFVYSSEVQKVHTDIVEFVKKRYYNHLKQTSDVKIILKMIKDELSSFIEKNIGRVPMLMPMFVYINRDAVKDESKLDAMSSEEAIVWMTIEEQWEDSHADL